MSAPSRGLPTVTRELLRFQFIEQRKTSSEVYRDVFQGKDDVIALESLKSLERKMRAFTTEEMQAFVDRVAINSKSNGPKRKFTEMDDKVLYDIQSSHNEMRNPVLRAILQKDWFGDENAPSLYQVQEAKKRVGFKRKRLTLKTQLACPIKRCDYFDRVSVKLLEMSPLFKFSS